MAPSQGPQGGRGRPAPAAGCCPRRLLFRWRGQFSWRSRCPQRPRVGPLSPGPSQGCLRGGQEEP
eukprot:3510714-Lingulodinium_polyedra.AAC.1